MTEKLVGYSIFNESKGDYLAKFLDRNDVLLRGFGTVEQALVFETLKKARKILSECNSDCSVVRLYKNEDTLSHKTVA